MLSRCWRAIEIWIALIAVALLTLACRLMWRGGSDAAAWFQAVGSIAAIGVAVYVPWKQRQDAERERRREAVQRALYIARRLKAVGDDLRVACLDLEARMRNVVSGPFVYNTENFRLVTEAANALEAIDFEHVATECCVAYRALVDSVKRGIHDVQYEGKRINETHFEQAAEWSRRAEALVHVAEGVWQYWVSKRAQFPN